MARCQNYKERSVVVKYVKQYSRSFLQNIIWEEKWLRWQYHDNRRREKNCIGHIIIAPRTKNSMVRSLIEHHLSNWTDKVKTLENTVALIQSACSLHRASSRSKLTNWEHIGQGTLETSNHLNSYVIHHPYSTKFWYSPPSSNFKIKGRAAIEKSKNCNRRLQTHKSMHVVQPEPRDFKTLATFQLYQRCVHEIWRRSDACNEQMHQKN
jgi:hypothetical protein